MISLMLDFAVGGRADNLMPFHLTSLCLHTVNTALVIVFLYMLFGDLWPAVMVGLLFGMHPLTVEPIPWIGERKTLLASFFALWCLVLYVRYTRKADWKLFIGVAAAYILALLSKPTVTFLPVLLLLLDFWPLRRLNKRALTEKLPLLVIMIIFAFITVISQGRSASIRMPGEYGPERIPLILCHNVIFYLNKIVWPAKLSSYYPFPNPFAPSNPIVLAGIVGTCVLLAILVISLRWTRAFLAGWLFFFVAIFPTMGVIGFTNVIACDKYAYFPSVGFLMVLTWLLERLWIFTRGLAVYRIIIVVFILSLAAAESSATHRYLLRWQTTEGLYEYMLRLNPDASSLHCDYGSCLFKNNQFGLAMQHFSEAVRLMPRNFQAYNNMGVVYSMEGKMEQAIVCWEKALKLKPDWADTINNLAWTKATNENPGFRNPEEALELALRACKLTEYSQPDYLDTLAAAYAAVGRFPDAIETARRALKLAQYTGQKELAKEMQNRLDLYQAGRCYLQKYP
jgi:Tfp pilus assembly protein PilF